MSKKTSKSDDDFELWRQFRLGNENAYASLMEKYSTPMYQYGYRIFSDDDFIKDCIQDVFFELWNRRDRINDTPSVKFYLFKAIRLRILRERSKWSGTEEIDEDYQFDVEFNIETKLINQQSEDEINQKIKNVLNLLPPRQKEIIYLRYFENLDYDKIGLLMDLNRQSVYNLVQKAVLRLRKEWILIVVLSYFIWN